MEKSKSEVVTFEQATALTGNKAIAFFSEVENVMSLVEQVKKEALSIVPDLTTKKGRDAIGTNALNVSKSRGVLEKALDSSVSAMAAKVKKVKEVKKVVISELKDVREVILEPRKKWQLEQDAIEEARVNAIKLKIDSILKIGLFDQADSKETLSNKIDALENIDVSDSFEEFTADAAKAVSEAISSLNARILNMIEEKKAEEQRLQLAAEKKKTRIQERLSNLVQIPLGLMGKSSLLIQKKINSLEAFVITDEDFEERCQEAVNSLNTVVGQLKMMFSQAEQLETMQRDQAAAQLIIEEKAKQDALNKQKAIDDQKNIDEHIAIQEHEEAIKINAEFDEYQTKQKTTPPTPIHPQKVSASKQDVIGNAAVNNAGSARAVEQVCDLEFTGDKPSVSQLQKSINAIEAQSKHVPLHTDYLNWAREYSIPSPAFLALEMIINKHLGK